MWRVPRPAISAEHSFSTCISIVRDDELKARLVAATPAVVAASEEFEAAAVLQVLHAIAPHKSVNGNVTKDEMEAVYTGRMVKKDTPGRALYDEIFSGAPHKRCPLCGQRTVSTLDHVLPKAHFPALAVTPLNLVPACGDCNKAKLASFPTKPEEVSLHPYFDDIDGVQWLRADVVQMAPTALIYRVEPSPTWGATLTQRVNHHFNSLHLADLYASEAAEELLNIRYELTEIRDNEGPAGVQAHLLDRAESRRRARRNGWRTAAYDAWAADPWFYFGGFELE